MKRILVCTDGEEHTLNAEEHAVMLADCLGSKVTGLYVQSTFLKKFTHEIYAVSRNECQAHLDASLRREGEAALESLGRLCSARAVPYEPKIRQGDIAGEIVQEVTAHAYDLLIMGAKLLGNWREKLESVNVPLDVFRRAPLPMLFVR
jgi:nucleotide-binding universal stress UspA family protein